MMGFSSGNGWGGQTKTAKDRKREELQSKIGRLKLSVAKQEKEILSRKTIRDLGFNEMVQAKAAVEKDYREMKKLERQLAKLDEDPK